MSAKGNNFFFSEKNQDVNSRPIDKNNIAAFYSRVHNTISDDFIVFVVNN